MYSNLKLILLQLLFVCIYITHTNSAPASAKTFEDIFSDAKAAEDYFIQTRRTLHQHPETRFEEYETSQIIKDFLKENNISYTEGWGVDRFNPTRGGTGVVADVGTGHQPCVIIRADIDALPIHEKTNFDFKSTHPGRMHACGHDSHTTMALAAAYLVKQYENEMEGTVRFMFTPAEEGGGGVKMMIDEGALGVYPQPQRAFGFHILPVYPTGTVYTRPGVLTGGVDHIKIIVKGRGGHGAMPHMNIDPIPASLAIVRALYDIYARETYFQEKHAGLVGVTHFEAGTGAHNVIPDEVVIGGTVQAIKTTKLNHLKKRIADMASSIAEAYQCTATISHRDTPYISIENDESIFPLYSKLVSEGTSDKSIHGCDSVFGGDDFCYFEESIPSIYSWLGSGSSLSTNGDPPTTAPLHNAEFALDEDVLARGAAMHAYIAIQNIKDLTTNSN